MSGELRSEKLIKNAGWGTAGYCLYMLAGFVSRSVFIGVLGETYAGVSTLFATVVNLLSIADLGFSNAVYLYLYRPVVEKNEEKITALMNLYGKVYRAIAVVVLAVGLAMTPFVHLMIKSEQKIPYLEIYFLLYVAKAAANYLFAYKNVLFSVYQEAYRTERIYYAILITTTILQVLVLRWTASFAAYLILSVVGMVLTNYIRTCMADARYPYLKKYPRAKITKQEKEGIVSYIKSIAIDRSASLLKATTDNIITSSFVSIAVTGIVGNYVILIDAANAIVLMLFNHATAAAGNMTVTADLKSQYRTFLDLNFVAFWIYGFICTGIACVSTPFICELWIRDANYALSTVTIFILCINLLLYGLEAPTRNFFDTTGLIKKIPYRNVWNSLLNIALSLVFVIPFGVNGVYLGTILSYVLTVFWMTPYITLRDYFEGQYGPFLRLYLRGFAGVLVGWALTFFACGAVQQTGIVGIAIRIAVCTMVFNTAFAMVFAGSAELSGMLDLVKTLIERNLKRGRENR